MERARRETVVAPGFRDEAEWFAAARRRFLELGMTGWAARAESLLA